MPYLTQSRLDDAVDCLRDLSEWMDMQGKEGLEPAVWYRMQAILSRNDRSKCPVCGDDMGVRCCEFGSDR